jgi:hypothetical protein
MAVKKKAKPAPAVASNAGNDEAAAAAAEEGGKKRPLETATEGPAEPVAKETRVE